MLKKVLVVLLAVFLIGLTTYGCGQVAEEGTKGNVEGYVYAADGTTPLAGASVTASDTSSSSIRALATNLGSTTTDSEGYFNLEVSLAGGITQVDIIIQKGAIEAVISDVNVSEGATTAVGDSNKKVILDPDNPPPNTVVTLAKMAVVTGSWDRMQDVLAKLGYGSADASGQLILGTEQFDLYDGNYSLPTTYETFDNLVNSPEAMAQYHVIFINCGNSYEYMLSDPSVVQNIQDYVNNGGSLYVTDLSYDFVEQCFPQYIDFYGSDSTPTSSPETMGAAEVGIDGITIDAQVMDATMRSWLDGLGQLNPDDTVHIAGFLSGWAVISGEASGTTVWIRGDAQFYTYSVLGAALREAGAHDVKASAASAFVTANKPLTVSFNHGSGRVLYSSYHTEDDPDPSLRPQEYVLAYLIFEL